MPQPPKGENPRSLSPDSAGVPARRSAREAVQGALRAAESFHGRHLNDAAVQRTFGYFTRHPVAPLNRKRLLLILEAACREQAQLQRPLRILDLACGGGLISCALASLGHRVVGADLSADEIRMAQLYAGEERLDGMFLQADLLGSPDWERRVESALGGKPDLVVLAYALHHLPEVETFVERLARWLDAGSALLINEENPRSPLFRLKHFIRGIIQGDTEIEWHRSFEGWRSLLQGSGFLVSPPLRGADLLPLLGRILPGWAWSLVFTARRG
jgi:2-polyprenyl-3-methyl-5-hydroxy-6-metoxy-1,4-benzoquinol methylase